MERPIAYNGNEPFIFVSYSHKDNAAVWPLISRMISDGYRVWYDDGINPGTSWDEFIANKIKECDYFIAFISENYIASDNCKDELNYAREQVDNKLLVYLSDVTLPVGMDMRLGRVQAIYAHKFQNINQLMDKLYTSKNITLFKTEKAYVKVSNPVKENSFINDSLEEKTEIFEVESKPVVEPISESVNVPEESSDSDMPKHVPVPKSINVKYIILVVLAAIIAAGLLFLTVNFMDDFLFFVGKYNGLTKAIKSMIVVVVSFIALAADIVVFLRLRRKFTR